MDLRNNKVRALLAILALLFLIVFFLLFRSHNNKESYETKQKQLKKVVLAEIIVSKESLRKKLNSYDINSRNTEEFRILDSTYKEYNKLCNRLESTLADLPSSLVGEISEEKLISKLDSLEDKLKELADSLEVETIKVNNLEENKKFMRERDTLRVKRIAELERINKELEEENEDLKAAISALESENRKLKGSQNELLRLKLKLAEKENIISRQENDIKKLNNRIRDLKSQLTNLPIDNDSRGPLQNEQRALIEDLKKANERLKKEKGYLEDDIKELDSISDANLTEQGVIILCRYKHKDKDNRQPSQLNQAKAKNVKSFKITLKVSPIYQGKSLIMRLLHNGVEYYRTNETASGQDVAITIPTDGKKAEAGIYEVIISYVNEDGNEMKWSEKFTLR